MHGALRLPVDPIGFATRAEQMNAIVHRIEHLRGDPVPSEQPSALAPEPAQPWRAAIVPHDDYAYVGALYSAVLAAIDAPTVIMIGVAHKARTLGLENELLFESFPAWSAPYGAVAVSSLREEIIAALPDDVFSIHDEMHALEHSLEAIVPFLQYRRRDVEIVPILVPAMPFERMQQVAQPLAMAIARAMRRRKLRWGEDVAIVISSDAVHYGDMEWGGRDFARFGVEAEGYRQAVEYERRIIAECLLGELSIEKLRAFTSHMVQPYDFREYRWTWCGRYSVPCGLLVALHLANAIGAPVPGGTLVGYGTSIDARPHVPVDDLGMGLTAPATLRHWVGYASIGYR